MTKVDLFSARENANRKAGEFIKLKNQKIIIKSSPASCEGAWLKFESCPSCNEPEINNQYNDYYYSSQEDSNYYESKTTESTKIRPKRSAEECFCNFSTSGNLKLLESKSKIKNK